MNGIHRLYVAQQSIDFDSLHNFLIYLVRAKIAPDDPLGLHLQFGIEVCCYYLKKSKVKWLNSFL